MVAELSPRQKSYYDSNQEPKFEAFFFFLHKNVSFYFDASTNNKGGHDKVVHASVDRAASTHVPVVRTPGTDFTTYCRCLYRIFECGGGGKHSRSQNQKSLLPKNLM